jgi:precorrin-2 dehydrogenase/sirohydrochlorin ferrochelatase
MDSFPAFFPMTGARVVVAGDGDIAEAKAALFVGSPAQVVRLRGAAAIDRRSYVGARLAFVAGDDPVFRKAAAAAANAAHVPVNVVDDPALCDFFTPAVIDRGSVVVAVGTSGASPLLAATLRDELEVHTPAAIGALASLLGAHRVAIRAAFPEIGRRSEFLHAWMKGPAGRAGLAGDIETARRGLQDALADHARVP